LIKSCYNSVSCYFIFYLYKGILHDEVIRYCFAKCFSLISSSDESNGKLPKDFKFTHNVDSSGSGPRTSFMSQWKKFTNENEESFNVEDCFNMTGEESEAKKAYCRHILLSYFSGSIDGPLVKNGKVYTASTSNISISSDAPLKVIKS